MMNDPFARALAAEVKTGIEEMKLTLFKNFDAMMECNRQGIPIPIEDRVRYRYDSGVVADRCLAMSSRMLKAIGSGGIRNGNRLLATHLDILASQAHVANHVNPFANNLGGILFGADNADMAI
jgi:3-hydroxy-9,10-secoandrosta-1,3,5(10)-triene-9,17-dione monooxygenase